MATENKSSNDDAQDEEMNLIIGKYYKYMQDKSYYEEDARGKFLAFCVNNDIKEDEMQNNYFQSTQKIVFIIILIQI